MRDITHKIDTPESAKSFRSVISPVNRKVEWKYEPVKSFKPDPPGQVRFADKIMHRAISTQIPGLLPALKNSPQFDEFEENLIYLRSPEFEQHKARSLHYFWLPPKERTELCGIFQSHVKPTDKRKTTKRIIPASKYNQLTGLAAEAAAIEQQEYLENIANDSTLFSNKVRVQKRRVSEVPSRIFRQNRKFQTSYWDPTFSKHLTDPFRRTRGRLPACEAICHEHFGIQPEVKEILACVDEYKKRYDETHDLSGSHIELQERRDQLRRLTLFGSLQDEEKRRGVKHIKELQEYDRESDSLWTKQAKLIISAAEYINKIKKGRRFPTPPRELRPKRKPRRNDPDQSDPESADSQPSTINVEEYIQKQKEQSGSGRRHHHKHKSRKKQHFHHTYNTEEFYMEMYLHFLNPDEDVTLKAPPKQMTDVKELRKRMNLDEDHEKDKKLMDLLNETSVDELHIHGGPRKSHDQSHSHSLTQDEIEHEKQILEHHMKKLNNPRLTHILTRMMSQMSLKSSTLTMTSSESKKSPTLNEEEEATTEVSPQDYWGTRPPTETETGAWTVPTPSTAEQKTEQPTQADVDDEDLDKMGDIPEHELKLIMSEIAVSSKGSGSTDNLSSGSSGEEEEEEGEGEHDGDDDALKLFKKARKKKDSLAEFMDLTTEFRARICYNEDGKMPTQMNPFAEAVCVLYPTGSEKPKAGKSKAGTGTKVLNSLASLKTQL